MSDLELRKGPSTQARNRTRAGVRPRSSTVSHPAAMPESLGRGRHPRRCCLSGMGASSGGRGEDTRRYGRLPVPGQGMPEPSESLPAPCRRVRGLHVSCAQRDRLGAAVKSTPGRPGPCPCLRQTAVRLTPSGRPAVAGPGSSPGKVVGPSPGSWLPSLPLPGHSGAVPGRRGQGLLEWPVPGVVLS
jgi:hypothetical protein